MCIGVEGDVQRVVLHRTDHAPMRHVLGTPLSAVVTLAAAVNDLCSISVRQVEAVQGSDSDSVWPDLDIQLHELAGGTSKRGTW